MEDVLQNIVPQAGILDNEENPVTDSERVKAPVVGAGSTNFGGEPEARGGQSGWCRRGESLGPYCISNDERRKKGSNQASAAQGESSL